MLTDGHGLYLRRDASGNFIPVKSKELADVWEKRNKASNVLANCVNKNFRDRYKVVEIEEDTTPKKAAKGKIKVTVKPHDNAAMHIGNEAIEENKICDLTENIESFVDFVQSTEQRKETLLSALSDVDKEISDINHYIELGDSFNAYQGWLAFNMLRNRLKKRRKIKDELYILTQLGECKVNSAMLEDIKNSIGNLDSREYKPRILNELFE